MPTTPAILTEASALSQAIRNSRDPLRTLSSVLNILAGGTDHDDMCSELERAAADAQTYAEMADEAKEARRAELEEAGHALALECVADRRDEWETDRRQTA